MTSTLSSDVPVRERLLLAGARLLEEAKGGDVSTRAITELAGVQAPALYHHFGSKQGLLDSVVSHGFRRFLQERRSDPALASDPVDTVREAWDIHVQFGLSYPTFYSYIYARVEPGTRCEVVSDVEAMLLETLEPAARAGRLTIPASAAATEILAASSGVILTLITGAGGDVDWSLSDRVRDAILSSITAGSAEPLPHRGAASTAVALAAMLDDGANALAPSETALLREWLHRLAAEV